MKKINYLLIMILPAIYLTGCANLFEPTHFGVKESVWVTLSEESKQKAIIGYNERQRRQQEIDAERARRQLQINAERAKRQQEIDAQNAPYEYALRIAEKLYKCGDSSRRPPCIRRINPIGRRITLNNGETYRIAVPEDCVDWSEGHDIIVIRKKERGANQYLLENLQTRERVKADRT